MTTDLTKLTNLQFFDILDCPLEEVHSLTNLTLLKTAIIAADNQTLTQEALLRCFSPECNVSIKDYGKFDKIVDGVYLGSYANAHNKWYLQKWKV